MNRHRFYALKFLLAYFLFVQELLKSLIGNQPHFMPHGQQSICRVILPEYQPVLAAGRHHAVRLRAALCHEVVHQRADVAGSAVEYHRFPALYLQRCVYSGDDSLRRSFLIAAGAVELTRAVKSGNALEFQRWQEFQRVAAVVLYRVSRAHYFNVLQSLYRAQEFHLHVRWQRRRHSLKIVLIGVKPHRLHKKLVTFLILKAHYLVLNTRAVTWTYALDSAGIKRRTVEIIKNDFMRFSVGVGHVAIRDVLHFTLVIERKRHYLLVTGLHLHYRKINGTLMHPRGRTGLEPAHGNTERFQAVSQPA